MEQNANMGTHMATHISGRATVAVYGQGSGKYAVAGVFMTTK